MRFDRTNQNSVPMISRIHSPLSKRASSSYKRQELADSGNSTSGSDGPASEESPDSLLSAVKTVSTYVQATSRDVHLYVDDSTGRQEVTVVDSATGQTIRHIPVDEVMQLSKHIASNSSDPIKGLLVRSKA